MLSHFNYCCNDLKYSFSTYYYIFLLNTGFEILFSIQWFVEQNKKLLKKFLAQGPGYSKKPLGHRVALPTLTKIIMSLKINVSL